MNSKYIKLQNHILFLIILVFSCDDPDYPEDIWNEDDTGGLSPVVTSVEPADGAFAGIDTLTITGQSFSDTEEENIVYFNNLLGNIVDATPNRILVIPPNLVSDSVKIKVAVQGAFLFGEYNAQYILTAAVMDYGPFDQFTDIYSLDLDREENVIVSMEGSPNAEFWKVDTNQDSTVWSGSLSKGSGMKLGPDGSVYFVNYQRYLYKDEEGTPKENTEIFKRVNGNSTDLDFDASGNLYLSGTGSKIDVVDINDDGGMTSGITEAKDLGDLDTKCLRVFGDFVYILTTNAAADEAIYRLPILDIAGTLGDLELVFDWSAYTNKESSALCFTLGENGELLIGSDSESQPLTFVNNDVVSAFYPTVLTPPINYMAWGNSQYLYIINRTEETNRVQRIDTRMNGAPYYGRP